MATGLAEVLRQKSVEDRVDTGVSIRQAVGDDAKDEGGVVQGEGAELRPHDDDVMGQPADGEGSYDQENSLSRLWDNREQTSCQGHTPTGACTITGQLSPERVPDRLREASLLLNCCSQTDPQDWGAE